MTLVVTHSPARGGGGGGGATGMSPPNPHPTYGHLYQHMTYDSVSGSRGGAIAANGTSTSIVAPWNFSTLELLTAQLRSHPLFRWMHGVYRAYETTLPRFARWIVLFIIVQWLQQALVRRLRKWYARRRLLASSATAAVVPRAPRLVQCSKEGDYHSFSTQPHASSSQLDLSDDDAAALAHSTRAMDCLISACPQKDGAPTNDNCRGDDHLWTTKRETEPEEETVEEEVEEVGEKKKFTKSVDEHFANLLKQF